MNDLTPPAERYTADVLTWAAAWKAENEDKFAQMWRIYSHSPTPRPAFARRGWSFLEGVALLWYADKLAEGGQPWAALGKVWGERGASLRVKHWHFQQKLREVE